jgi:nicotinate-nucleotide pyrophosphorylase (carboxylating)
MTLKQNHGQIDDTIRIILTFANLLIHKFMDTEQLLHDIITLAVKEDIGDGDHTTLACIPKYARGQAKLLVKEFGIIAGVDAAQYIFTHFDPSTYFYIYMKDGMTVKPGDVVFTVEGNVRTLLQMERLVLNVMQRMSGIATVTNRYVQELKGTHANLLDTRKTTPGIRVWEKMAVKIGGGGNHRFGLSDMVLIKDNHVDFIGGVKQAIIATGKYLQEKQLNIPIEIEVRNIEELQQVLDIGHVNRILLDNFNVELTKQAVKLVNKQYQTEASGNITLDNIRQYAETGVDFISTGSITHSVKGIDLSLKKD